MTKQSRLIISHQSKSPALDNAKTDTRPTYRSVIKLDRETYITNPTEQTREIQKHLLFHLQRRDEPSRYSLFGVAEGYKRLEILQGFYDLILLDLDRCFEKITYTRVVGLLRSRGLPTPDEYARYCVYNSTLSRGSHCSNYILELILKRLDYRLAGLAKRSHLFYKRYVDDLWFYGDLTGIETNRLLFYIRKAIKAEGFSLNESKTRIEFSSEHANIPCVYGRNQSPF